MGLVTILIVKQEMVEAPDIKRKKIQVVRQIVVTIYCKDHINTRKEMWVGIVEISLLWIINKLEHNIFMALLHQEMFIQIV